MNSSPVDRIDNTPVFPHDFDYVELLLQDCFDAAVKARNLQKAEAVFSQLSSQSQSNLRSRLELLRKPAIEELYTMEALLELLRTQGEPLHEELQDLLGKQSSFAQELEDYEKRIAVHLTQLDRRKEEMASRRQALAARDKRLRWLRAVLPLVLLLLITATVAGFFNIGTRRPLTWYGWSPRSVEDTPSPVPTARPNSTPMPVVTESVTPTQTSVITENVTLEPAPTPAIPPTPTSTTFPLTLFFPREGASYPVFPWQVWITGTKTITTPLTLRLQPESAVVLSLPEIPAIFDGMGAFMLKDLVWLTTTMTFSATTPLTITESVAFPNGVDTSAYSVHLYRLVSQPEDWQLLPGGAYTLNIAAEDGTPLSLPVEFTLDRSAVMTATIASPERVLLRPFPTSPANNGLVELPRGTEVQVLGQVWYITPDGQLADENKEKRPGDLWCHFRIADGRSGWSWCVDFDFSETVPGSAEDAVPGWDVRIDNFNASQKAKLQAILTLRLPILSPPLPSTLYLRGGQ